MTPKEYFSNRFYSSYSNANRAIKNYEKKNVTKLKKVSINQLDEGCFEVIVN